MRIVIVGDGKVGSALTEMLSGEGHDIVVIDSNKKVLVEELEATDVMVVHGNGAALSVQREAGVEDSDLLVAATSGDEINMLSCMLARKLGCGHTIARVRNPDYIEQLAFMKDELGLNMAVNPELSTAQEIFRLLQYPSFLQRDSFAKGRVEIVQIELKEGNRLIGKKLSEMYKIAKVKVLVCSVERGDKVHIPDGSFKLKEGDTIFVTAPAGDLVKLIRNLGLDNRKIRNVFIVGGGSNGYYLANLLLKSGIEVKIIEKDAKRCEWLAEDLPHAQIINADASEKWVLDSEGMPKADAVVTLTNMDEENLIISMYADYLKVPRVITKINRTEYDDVFRGKGSIQYAISPKELCSREIATYVRAMQSAIGVNVETVHKIGMMEALEFHVTERTKHLGVALKDLRLRPGVLVSCIIRGNEVIIPGGFDKIEQGDIIIIATSADSGIEDINEIFDRDWNAKERTT